MNPSDESGLVVRWVEQDFLSRVDGWILTEPVVCASILTSPEEKIGPDLLYIVFILFSIFFSIVFYFLPVSPLLSLLVFICFVHAAEHQQQWTPS